jgi:hypothetical protein
MFHRAAVWVAGQRHVDLPLVQQPGDVRIDAVAADQRFDEGLGQLRRGDLARVQAAIDEEAARLGAGRQLVGDARHQQVMPAQVLATGRKAAPLLFAPRVAVVDHLDEVGMSRLVAVEPANQRVQPVVAGWPGRGRIGRASDHRHLVAQRAQFVDLGLGQDHLGRAGRQCIVPRRQQPRQCSGLSAALDDQIDIKARLWVILGLWTRRLGDRRGGRGQRGDEKERNEQGGKQSGTHTGLLLGWRAG